MTKNFSDKYDSNLAPKHKSRLQPVQNGTQCSNETPTLIYEVEQKRKHLNASKQKKRHGIDMPVPLWSAEAETDYIIFASKGTISNETMLMILIIGLTAGPAVSL